MASISRGGALVFNAQLNLNTNNLNRQVRRTAKQIQGNFNSLHLNPRGMKGFQQSLGRITGQATEFRKSMDAATARVFAFGATAAVLNTVTQSFRALVSTTIEVEKRLIEIDSIMGGTAEEMQHLRKAIFEIGKNTGQSFTTVADGAAELARQGLKAAETQERLNAALILTRISGLDSVSSVNALTAAINGYTRSALQAEEIVNKIVAVDTKFAVSAKDLADGFQRAGATAEDAGVSFDELLGIITAVQQTTARGGAVIGNALKSIFTRISRTDSLAQLKDLGVQIDASQSGIQKLNALSAALERLSDPTKKNKIKELAGGVFQINVVSAALKDLAKDQSLFREATAISSNATSEAFDKNEKLAKSLSSQINELVVGMTDLGNKVGAITLAPIIKDLVTLANKVSDFFGTALDPESGSNVIKDIFKGIAKFIQGPGVVLITGAFLKILQLVGRFARQGLNEVLHLNSASQRIKDIEGGIVQLLVQDDKLRASIASKSVTIEQKHRLIQNAIKQENSLLLVQKNLLRDLAAGVYARGGRGYSAGGQLTNRFNRPISSFAAGNYPSAGMSAGMSGTIKKNTLDYARPVFDRELISEVKRRARAEGARGPINVYMSTGPAQIGGQHFIFNDQELMVPRAGGGKDAAVIPSYKAPPKHRKLGKIFAYGTPIENHVQRSYFQSERFGKIFNTGADGFKGTPEQQQQMLRLFVDRSHQSNIDEIINSQPEGNRIRTLFGSPNLRSRIDSSVINDNWNKKTTYEIVTADDGSRNIDTNANSIDELATAVYKDSALNSVAGSERISDSVFGRKGSYTFNGSPVSAGDLEKLKNYDLSGVAANRFSSLVDKAATGVRKDIQGADDASRLKIKGISSYAIAVPDANSLRYLGPSSGAGKGQASFIDEDNKKVNVPWQFVKRDGKRAFQGFYPATKEDVNMAETRELLEERFLKFAAKSAVGYNESVFGRTSSTPESIVGELKRGEGARGAIGSLIGSAFEAAVFSAFGVTHGGGTGQLFDVSDIPPNALKLFRTLGGTTMGAWASKAFSQGGKIELKGQGTGRNLNSFVEKSLKGRFGKNHEGIQKAIEAGTELVLARGSLQIKSIRKHGLLLPSLNQKELSRSISKLAPDGARFNSGRPIPYTTAANAFNFYSPKGPKVDEAAKGFKNDIIEQVADEAVVWAKTYELAGNNRSTKHAARNHLIGGGDGGTQGALAAGVGAAFEAAIVDHLGLLSSQGDGSNNFDITGSQNLTKLRGLIGAPTITRNFEAKVSSSDRNMKDFVKKVLNFEYKGDWRHAFFDATGDSLPDKSTLTQQQKVQRAARQERQGRFQQRRERRGLRTSSQNIESKRFGRREPIQYFAGGHIPPELRAREELTAMAHGAPSTVRAKRGKGTIGGKPFVMNNHETEIVGAGPISGDSAVIPNYARIINGRPVMKGAAIMPTRLDRRYNPPEVPHGMSPIEDRHITLLSRAASKKLSQEEQQRLAEAFKLIDPPQSANFGKKFHAIREAKGKESVGYVLKEQAEFREYLAKVFKLAGVKNPEPDRLFHLSTAAKQLPDTPVAFSAVGDVGAGDVPNFASFHHGRGGSNFNRFNTGGGRRPLRKPPFRNPKQTDYVDFFALYENPMFQRLSVRDRESLNTLLGSYADGRINRSRGIQQGYASSKDLLAALGNDRGMNSAIYQALAGTKGVFPNFASLRINRRHHIPSTQRYGPDSRRVHEPLDYVHTLPDGRRVRITSSVSNIHKSKRTGDPQIHLTSLDNLEPEEIAYLMSLSGQLGKKPDTSLLPASQRNDRVILTSGLEHLSSAERKELGLRGRTKKIRAATRSQPDELDEIFELMDEIAQQPEFAIVPHRPQTGKTRRLSETESRFERILLAKKKGAPKFDDAFDDLVTPVTGAIGPAQSMVNKINKLGNAKAIEAAYDGVGPAMSEAIAARIPLQSFDDILTIQNALGKPIFSQAQIEAGKVPKKLQTMMISGGHITPEEMKRRADLQAKLTSSAGAPKLETLYRSDGKGGSELSQHVVDPNDTSANRHRAANQIGRRHDPNINRVSVDDLVAAQLPLIDADRARAIVREREANGPFKNMADLERRVTGMGSRIGGRLENRITFAKGYIPNFARIFARASNGKIRELTGGELQRGPLRQFENEAGDVIQGTRRSKGIIDSDVLQNPKNVDKVADAMLEYGIIDAQGYHQYAMTGKLPPQSVANYNKFLSQRAIEKEKRTSLVVGPVGAGKTFLSRGGNRGKAGQAFGGQKTVDILTPADIDALDDVIIARSETSASPLLNNAIQGEGIDRNIVQGLNRIVVLSSRENPAHSEILRRRHFRSSTGEGLERAGQARFGRQPTTDTAILEGLAIEASRKFEIGGAGDRARPAFVNIRENFGSSLARLHDVTLNDGRLLKGNTPQLKSGQVAVAVGGFSPTTAGHADLARIAGQHGIAPENTVFLISHGGSFSKKQAEGVIGGGGFDDHGLRGKLLNQRDRANIAAATIGEGPAVSVSNTDFREGFSSRLPFVRNAQGDIVRPTKGSIRVAGQDKLDDAGVKLPAFDDNIKLTREEAGSSLFTHFDPDSSKDLIDDVFDAVVVKARSATDVSGTGARKLLLDFDRPDQEITQQFASELEKVVGQEGARFWLTENSYGITNLRALRERTAAMPSILSKAQTNAAENFERVIQPRIDDIADEIAEINSTTREIKTTKPVEGIHRDGDFYRSNVWAKSPRVGDYPTEAKRVAKLRKEEKKLKRQKNEINSDQELVEWELNNPQYRIKIPDEGVGTIPSFARNPIADAVARETTGTGVKPHQVRLDTHPLAKRHNPMGLVVTNTRDQAGGRASSVSNRDLIAGKHVYPNFSRIQRITNSRAFKLLKKSQGIYGVAGDAIRGFPDAIRDIGRGVRFAGGLGRRGAAGLFDLLGGKRRRVNKLLKGTEFAHNKDVKELFKRLPRKQLDTLLSQGPNGGRIRFGNISGGGLGGSFDSETGILGLTSNTRLGLRGIGGKRAQEEALNVLLHESGHAFDFSKTRVGASTGDRLAGLLSSSAGFRVALQRDKRRNGFAGNLANNLLADSAVSNLSDQEFFAETYAMAFSNTARAKQWRKLFPEATKAVKKMVKGKTPNFADDMFIFDAASGELVNPLTQERIPFDPDTGAIPASPSGERRAPEPDPAPEPSEPAKKAAKSKPASIDPEELTPDQRRRLQAANSGYTIVSDPQTGKQRLVRNDVLARARQEQFAKRNRGRVVGRGGPPRVAVRRGKPPVPTLLARTKQQGDRTIGVRRAPQVPPLTRRGSVGPRPVPVLSRSGATSIDPVTGAILNTRRAGAATGSGSGIGSGGGGGTGGGGGGGNFSSLPDDDPNRQLSAAQQRAEDKKARERDRKRVRARARRGKSTSLSGISQNRTQSSKPPKQGGRLGSAALGLSFAASFLLPQLDEGLNKKFNKSQPEVDKLSLKLRELVRELENTDEAINPERHAELTKAIKQTESGLRSASRAAEEMSGKISLFTGLGLAAVSAMEPLSSAVKGLGKAASNVPLGPLAAAGSSKALTAIGGSVAGGTGLAVGGAIAAALALAIGGGILANKARKREIGETSEEDRLSTKLFREGKEEGDTFKTIQGVAIQTLTAPFDAIGKHIGKVEKNFDIFDGKLIGGSSKIDNFGLSFSDIIPSLKGLSVSAEEGDIGLEKFGKSLGKTGLELANFELKLPTVRNLTEFFAKPLTGFTIDQLNDQERQYQIENSVQAGEGQERLATYGADGRITGFNVVSNAQAEARRQRIQGERVVGQIDRLREQRQRFDDLGIDTTRTVVKSRVGQISKRDKQFQQFDFGSARNQISLQESLARFLPEGTADEANRKSQKLLKLEEQKLRLAKNDADSALNLSTELPEINIVDFDKSVDNIRTALNDPKFAETFARSNFENKRTIRKTIDGKRRRGEFDFSDDKSPADAAKRAEDIIAKRIEKETISLSKLRGIEDNKKFFQAFSRVKIKDKSFIGDARGGILNALSAEAKEALRGEKLISGAFGNRDARSKEINDLTNFRDFIIDDDKPLTKDAFEAFEDKVDEIIKKGINVEGIEEWRSANHELFAGMVQLQQQRMVEERAAFERTRAENKAFLQQYGQSVDNLAAKFRNLGQPNAGLNTIDINNPFGANNDVLFDQLGVAGQDRSRLRSNIANNQIFNIDDILGKEVSDSGKVTFRNETFEAFRKATNIARETEPLDENGRVRFSKGVQEEVFQKLDFRRAEGLGRQIGGPVNRITRQFSQLQNADSVSDVLSSIDLIRQTKTAGEAAIRQIPLNDEAGREQLRGVVNSLISEMGGIIQQSVAGTTALGFADTARANATKEEKIRSKFDKEQKDIDTLLDEDALKNKGTSETATDKDVLGDQIKAKIDTAAKPLYDSLTEFQGNMKKFNGFMSTAAKDSEAVAQELKRANAALAEVSQAIDVPAIRDVFDKLREAANEADAKELTGGATTYEFDFKPVKSK